MLEEILDYRNITKALQQVMSNKGAGGVDGMQTEELRDWLEGNWAMLKQSILEGSYRPQPVRKVEIPKPHGGTRMLGLFPQKPHHCHQIIQCTFADLPNLA